MKVSVILPFYNAVQTLEIAIRSILDQTFQDFELLLIDNNSIDGSTEIARRALEDGRVRLIQESNQGVVYAANRGLEEACGSYIARMDADDWSFPNRLEKQVELLDTNPSIGLVSGGVEYFGKSPKEGFTKYLDWINGLVGINEIYLNQFVEYPIVNPSIMFRRELTEKFGVYKSGDFPEDYEYFLRLQQEGVRMKKADCAVIKWNDLPNRLTRTHVNYSEEAFDRIKSKYLQKWLKEHNPYYPNIWIWGAGKKARQKSVLLRNQEVEISGFIDVSVKNHSGDSPVIHFDSLPDQPDRFIVSYVSKWGARQEIQEFLKLKGWKEGIDFIMAA
ncbi:MAG: glycosyltransferase [Cytophagales bacterium]|nr:glycosyltransferase [Cytophagales bacterium]